MLIMPGTPPGMIWLKFSEMETLDAKLEVQAHAFSKSAQEAIEKSGGTAVKIEYF
jgi:ribosomal protein L18E